MGGPPPMEIFFICMVVLSTTVTHFPSGEKLLTPEFFGLPWMDFISRLSSGRRNAVQPSVTRVL